MRITTLVLLTCCLYYRGWLVGPCHWFGDVARRSFRALKLLAQNKTNNHSGLATWGTKELVFLLVRRTLYPLKYTLLADGSAILYCTGLYECSPAHLRIFFTWSRIKRWTNPALLKLPISSPFSILEGAMHNARPNAQCTRRQLTSSLTKSGFTATWRKAWLSNWLNTCYISAPQAKLNI